MPRKSRVRSIRILHGRTVVEELKLSLQRVSRIRMLYCRNWAEIRHLPQKEVFGVYLARYSFPPRISRVRSMRILHGRTVVEELKLSLQRVSKTCVFHPQKMACFPPKRFLVSTSSDKPSRPQFNHIIPSIWSMGGVCCGGLNGIHRECREFDHDDPQKSSETENYSNCGRFHCCVRMQ